jgi:hypothetical protein
MQNRSSLRRPENYPLPCEGGRIVSKHLSSLSLPRPENGVIRKLRYQMARLPRWLDAF